MKKSLIIDIHTHCIETTAKNEFKKRMDSYFSEDDPDKISLLEEEIDILREFIEESDFPALRASDERFSGEKPSRAMLQRGDDMKVHVYILED